MQDARDRTATLREGPGTALWSNHDVYRAAVNTIMRATDTVFWLPLSAFAPDQVVKEFAGQGRHEQAHDHVTVAFSQSPFTVSFSTAIASGSLSTVGSLGPSIPFGGSAHSGSSVS